MGRRRGWRDKKISHHLQLHIVFYCIISISREVEVRLVSETKEYHDINSVKNLKKAFHTSKDKLNFAVTRKMHNSHFSE